MVAEHNIFTLLLSKNDTVIILQIVDLLSPTRNLPQRIQSKPYNQIENVQRWIPSKGMFDVSLAPAQKYDTVTS